MGSFVLNPQISKLQTSLPYDIYGHLSFFGSSLGTTDTEPHIISIIQTPLSYGQLSLPHRYQTLNNPYLIIQTPLSFLDGPQRYQASNNGLSLKEGLFGLN